MEEWSEVGEFLRLLVVHGCERALEYDALPVLTTGVPVRHHCQPGKTCKTKQQDVVKGGIRRPLIPMKKRLFHFPAASEGHRRQQPMRREEHHRKGKEWTGEGEFTRGRVRRGRGSVGRS